MYSMPVTGWVVGPKGTLHPGVLAFLAADAPLLAAVVSTLPPATPTTTAEVSITFLGTASLGDSAPCRGARHPRGRSRSTGLARGLRPGARRPPARARDIARLHPPGARSRRRRPAHGASRSPGRRDPDPYLRPVDGGTLEGDAIATTSGVGLLRRQLAGELRRPPIDHLTGMRLTAAEEGRVTFALPAGPWATNEFGTVFGGMLALLAASAASAAVQSVAESARRSRRST